ncbi:MAG: prephenate dehydrogenase/arogenate dehydrogenase family protein [Candidatus Nanohaloarchaea archaeon]
MIGKKVAIVGGTGKFGQHLAGHLEENNEVSVSGRSLEKAREAAEGEDWDYGRSSEVVEGADVVIVAVPISVTVEVIHEVGEEVPEDALFCDITSVKKKPVEAMKKYSDEVLGMHPMYAPTNSIEGQKVVLCPEKGKKWTEMEEFWESRGAETHITDPETHDEAMSIVQGLMHFSELVVAETIRKSDLSGEEISNYSSPVYQLITDLTARILNQKAGLYGSIQAENPENEEVRERFIESAEELSEIIGDEEAFRKKFEQLGEEFDLESAQSRTDRVIEFLSGEVR